MRPTVHMADLLQRQMLREQTHAIFARHAPDAALPAFRQVCKDYLQQGRLQLQDAYRRGAGGPQLVHGQCRLADHLLTQIWQHLPRLLQRPAPQDLALVAVGGYGRGELHPHSDVDLLFLFGSEAPSAEDLSFVETLVTFLWDIRLEVGHSARTVSECLAETAGDITIATSLLEARWLAGSKDSFARLQHSLKGDNPWTSAAFFEAKVAEQRARHARFGDTAYNLEPNVKDGPGALRDLQVIEWVAKRHSGCLDLRCLSIAGIITREEYRTLIRARNFLWRLRAGLHYAAGRKEERLLFDYQYRLAEELGYQDTRESLAVEKLMKRYFRTLKEVSILTEMLLQTLREDIIPVQHGEPRVLDADFEVRDGRLRAIDLGIFAKQPHSILTLFQHLQRQPAHISVGARTMRALRANLGRIDRRFREDPRNQAAFMAILRHGSGLTRVLRHMNAYGVLGAYIPPFGRIVGQMQHDLFHVYTVDQHTLFLVRNLRRFAVPDFAGELPLCSQIYGQIDKPELLIIAGLFHDIAKGRGGDHSQLGAEDVQRFCQRHGLPAEDTALVTWLVRQHLVMSSTSQRRDIEDPEVIGEFARLMGDQRHLDYLLLLTVADIRATNPGLWNSWKGQLLWDLYHATSAALRRDTLAPVDSDALIRHKQSDVLNLLPSQAEGLAQRHWERLSSAYFFRYDPQEIAWHTQAIVESHSLDLPLVRARLHPQHAGTEILVYAPNVEGLFTHLTGALDRLGLNVVDARLDVTPDGFALDTFRVLDGDNGNISDPRILRELEQRLQEGLRGQALRSAPAWRVRRRRRQASLFNVPTEVSFNNQALEPYTLMEVIAPDRPGLLYRIAQALQSLGIQVHGAKVATFGERAEDTFFLVDKHGAKLDEAVLPEVETRLITALTAASAVNA
ncbi:MAG: [protein-PII] uridylyltransferase [Pseudomonadota bacterium]